MDNPQQPLIKLLIVSTVLLLSLNQGARADYATTWPPGSCSTVAAVPMTATVNASTPSIQLNFPRPGAYQIFRKDAAATTWGSALTTLPANSTTWTDSAVSVGQLYEYKAIMTDGTKSLHVANPQTFVGGTDPPIGYLLSGIAVDETQPRGRVVLVVTTDVQANLPTELAQYQADLVADGWFVHVISVPRAVSYDVAGVNALATVTVTSGGTGYTTGTPVGLSQVSGTSTPTAIGTLTIVNGTTSIAVTAGGGGFSVGSPLYITKTPSGGVLPGSGAVLSVGSIVSGTTNPVPIRDQIKAIYTAYPGEVKNVILLGKVPACRTGGPFVWDPDGHGVNVAGYGADGFYANMTGTWTDTSSNYQYMGANDISTSSGKLNLPGDNKYDQYYMAQTGGVADMGFGRIDLSNNILGEYEALRTYFNKLHRYKVASPDFLPGRKIALRTGAFPNIDETCWTGALAISGALSNVDVVKTLPTVPNYMDADAAYTAANGPYLFYFKGNGGPQNSVGGKAVFWTGMQSHWGWWFNSTVTSSENTMALRLGEDSYTLSFTWDIFGTRYFYHRMGMGLDAGDMMRVSINNVDSIVGTYSFVTDAAGTHAPCLMPVTGGLFMNHFGDPTLRLYMFAPPTNLSVLSTGGHPVLTWTASTEPTILGYHVYRTPLASGVATGPAQRITASPIAATTYTDNDPTAGQNTGQWSYMVRAIRLETTGAGTFYNASLGASQPIDMTNAPATLQITTPSPLSDAYWNTAYQTSLTATGGTHLFNWTILSGSLPPGLSLAANGMISGSATTAGIYNFTAQVTDALGATAQKAFTITALSNNAVIIRPEASSYMYSTAPDRVQGATESIIVSGKTSLIQKSLLRFNLAGLSINNSFVSAKLRLFVGPTTQANCNAILQAALSADAAGAAWVVDTVTYNTMPADNPSSPTTLATAYPVAGSYLDIDVTPQLRTYLAGYSSGKINFKLSTASQQTVNLSSAFSYGGAIPQLIIQTTNAPLISITSPAISPAYLNMNSGLLITASATAIPATAANLATSWMKLSGPGTVTFSTPNQPSTTATFSAAGDYVLRLSAADGVLQSAKDITVRVLYVPASTSPVTGPTDGLVLRLPFDESSGTTATDVSGVSPANSGSLAGTTNPAWTPAGGRIGGALTFSGTGQRVDIPDSATNLFDGTAQMSASFWMYASAVSSSSTTYNPIISKRTASFSKESYAMSLRGAAAAPWKMYFDINNKSLVSTVAFSLNIWYHVVMVFDGTAAQNLRLYVNGTPDTFGTIAQATVPRNATSPLRIGALDSADPIGWNGLIDEVRIYNRALTLAEVQDLYAAAPSNIGPKITLNNASVTGTAGSPVAVGATVTDDGVPQAVQVGWSKQSGPGSVVFSDPISPTSNATASAAGSYGLRITANDGSITTFADVAASFEASGGIESWRQLHFGTTENSGDAADDANPKHDGLRNLLKYVLGLDPNTDYSNSPLAPKGRMEDVGGENRLTFTFTRDTAVTDATLSVEVVNDLTSAIWTTIDPLNPANQVEVLDNTPSAGLQTITVKDTQPVTSATKRFMRLKVTRP